MINSDDITRGVREVCIQALRVPEDQVTPEARLVEDLNVDSLFVVQLAMALEEKFGVELPEKGLGRVETVQDMIDYVKRQIEVG